MTSERATGAVELDDRTPTEDDLAAADLVRADVDLRVRRRHLHLLTSHDLFSGDAVDGGSTLLLRSVRKAIAAAPATVTDVGCGYGPLGLWCAATWPEAEVRMTDRDALAVAFARVNAARNDLAVPVAPTLLLDGEPGGRDLVVSNVPGKAGPRALGHLVRQGLAALSPDGRLCLVAVQPVAEGVVGAAVDAGGAVLDRHDNATYAVVVLAAPEGGAPPPEPSFAAGAYERDVSEVEVVGVDHPLRIRTVHGLPEFDTAAHATILAWQRLRRGRIGHLLVVNPGQGIVPLAAASKDGVELELVSRDLLQLRASLRALDDAGAAHRATARHLVPALHAPPPCTTAVVLCGRRDRVAEVALLLARLAEGGTTRIVLAGRSRTIADVARAVRRERTWWAGEEDTHHGATALELTPRPERTAAL